MNYFYPSNYRVIPVFLIAFFSLSQFLFAQLTWDGGAGTDAWTDAENWNSNTVPGPNDAVILIGVDVVLYDGSDADIENIELCCGSTLDIQQGATLVAEYLSLQHDDTEVTNNGTLQITGGFSYGVSLGGHTFMQNNGLLDIDNTGADGAIRLFGANLVNDGNIDINTSTNEGDGIHTFNAAGVTSTMTNYGTVTIANTMGDGISGGGDFFNHGTVDITNVTFFRDLLLDGEDGLEFQHYAGAMFRGDGKLDPTTLYWNGGEFSTETLNSNPGIVEFFCLGNCTGENFTNAQLRFNIEGVAGPGVANGHDQVQVNEHATLGGTFELVLNNGFSPVEGDRFVLMTYASQSGNNPQFILPTLSSNLEWQITIGPNEIEAEVASLLPVEMIEFKARAHDDYIALNWATGSESNNEGFFIEKSTDGMNWELLDFVKGNGTTHNISEYKYNDPNPYIGKNYYRLAQNDFDGTENKSKVISINFDPQGLNDNINLYPNPARRGHDLNIAFPNEEIEYDRIDLFNARGQLIYSELNISQNMEINTADFSEGMYWVVFENGSRKTQQRFIVSQ